MRRLIARPKAACRQPRGFSLIELMFTIAILAILAAIAIPSFSDLIKQNQLTADANELVGALTRARSEAINRNYSVWVDADGAGWDAGWEIVPATQTNPSARSSNRDDVIRTFAGLDSDNALTCKDGCNSIRFHGDGRAGSSEEFRLAHPDGENGRVICLRATGQVDTFKYDEGGTSTSCN